MQCALTRLLEGRRVIVSDAILDAIDRTDIASCRNANRCGILDAYIAWIPGVGTAPPDMVRDMAGFCSGTL